MIQSQIHSYILTLFLSGFKDYCFPKTAKNALKQLTKALIWSKLKE